MRKPRDIDAELRALAERAKGLKARKVTQLGELVIATGAGDLEPDLLAGLLLSATETTDAATARAWSANGAAFFQAQGTGKPSPKARANRASPPSGAGGDASS